VKVLGDGRDKKGFGNLKDLPRKLALRCVEKGYEEETKT